MSWAGIPLRRPNIRQSPIAEQQSAPDPPMDFEGKVIPRSRNSVPIGLV